MSIIQPNHLQGKTTMTEVRFLKGENKRFPNAKQAAKNAGYPDVFTYLRSTGQVDCWCEELSDEEYNVQLLADQARKQIAQR